MKIEGVCLLAAALNSAAPFVLYSHLFTIVQLCIYGGGDDDTAIVIYCVVIVFEQ